MTVLTLTFSEALAEPKTLLDSLFEYKLWKSGALVYEVPKTLSSDCADGYRYGCILLRSSARCARRR